MAIYDEFEVKEIDKTYRDIMSVGTFIDNIISGGFTDYDGFARFILNEGDKQYEITNATYSIRLNCIFLNENKFLDDIVDFCKNNEIYKVVWYNK